MMQAAAGENRDIKGRTSKALWIPVFWLLIAGSRPVSSWFYQGLTDTTNVWQEGSPFDRNLLSVLIVAALVVLLSRRRRVETLLRANGPILLFAGYCLLSIFWSDFPDVAFKRWIRYLGDLSMVLVVVTDAVPATALATLLQRTSLILLPPSILLDVYRGLIGRHVSHMGMTTDKNMLGAISMVLGLGGLWCLSNAMRSKERKGRTKRLFTSVIVVAMALWCLVMANSATSIGAFLVGSILIVAGSRMALLRKPAVAFLFITAMVAAAIYAAILNPNVGVVETMGRNPDLTGRTEVWQAIIPLNPDPWIGAGFESFWMGSRLRVLWRIFVWHPNEAHNGYIETYLNLGWIGVSLLGVIIVTTFRKVITAFRDDGELGIIRMTYFAAAIVYNLTEAGFRMFHPVSLAFLLSVAAVLKSQPESPKLAPAIKVSTEMPELAAHNRKTHASAESWIYRAE